MKKRLRRHNWQKFSVYRRDWYLDGNPGVLIVKDIKPDMTTSHLCTTCSAKVDLMDNSELECIQNSELSIFIEINKKQETFIKHCDIIPFLTLVQMKSGAIP